jgi:membrane-bound lytic murein transglycosylase D
MLIGCLLFAVQMVLVGQSTDFSDSIFIKRLAGLNFAFELPYNAGVGNRITTLTHQKKNVTSEVLGAFFAEKSYFDSVFKAARLPTELQYLPLALTQMNPLTHTSFQRDGIWKLPYFIAIKYGLTITDKIDERNDIQKATSAAVAYLQTLSEKYTAIWDVIIAYANSIAAFESAKIRAEYSNDIWRLYMLGNLPEKDIIPDYIVYVYLVHFYQSHHILPIPPVTEQQLVSVHLREHVPLQKFITLLQLSESSFRASNPVLIGKMLPKEYVIFIPAEKQMLFFEQENNLYIVDTTKINSNTEQHLLAKPKAIVASPTKTIYHTVQSGDVLGRLALKYNTNVAQLKKWNNLSNDNIYIGQRLIVQETASAQKTESKTAPPTVSNNEKNIPTDNKKENKTIYTVKSGDTLTKIAKLYDVSVEQLKKWNNLKDDRIDIQQKLIIYANP